LIGGKKHMKRPNMSRSVLLVFALLLFIPCIAASESPPYDIKKAAKEGIHIFLKDGRSSNLHHLGFESQADVDSAELSEEFHIFTIRPDKLLNESAVQDIDDLVVPMTQWQFLIRVRGKARALLTVDLVNGKWVPVSIGSAGLAKQLSEISAVWPMDSGYQYRLIRVYEAQSDFIELSRRGKKIGILPLTSFLQAIKAGEKKTFDPHDLRYPKEVLTDLRPVVRENMQSKR
jgi:hypothetical protein